ncbi:MAG: FGGY family carbohydrate kinase [Streptosporangiales bacterium]
MASVRYLGVDVGTTVTKAALFDEAGDVVAIADRPTQLSHPGENLVEQDVEEVLHSVANVVADVRSDDAIPSLLAITGQGDGCWLVDGDGRPVRPAVSWMDGRAGDIYREWERDGTVEALYAINGNVVFPGSQACLLRWFADNEPAALDRATTAGYCKDVIVQRLTGTRATDPSDASLPFGVGDGYAHESIELCGLGEHTDLLAPVSRPLPVAELSGAGAELTGLPAGTPVTGGPFDLPACAAGAGVLEPGDGLLTIGTTLACQVLVDEVDVSGSPAGMHLAAQRPGRWLRALPAMVGCASLDWLLGMLDMSADEVSPAIEQSPAGAGGVEVLPYLAPSGERAPFIDPAARGQLTGVRLSTTRQDAVRAMCEGIAFAARDCFAATPLTGRLLVCGGGARSRPWLQIFADVLQRTVHVARTPEVGARGAVLSALAALDRPADVPEWTRPEATVEPDPAMADRYDEAFARYQQHRQAAQQMWRTA